MKKDSLEIGKIVTEIIEGKTSKGFILTDIVTSGTFKLLEFYKDKGKKDLIFVVSDIVTDDDIIEGTRRIGDVKTFEVYITTVDEDESTFFVDSLFEKCKKELVSSTMFYYKGSETFIVTPETIDKYK